MSSLAVAAAVAGCGGSSGSGAQNKAGASLPTKSQTLVVQATDASSPEAQRFVNQIEQRSGGTLSVQLQQDYPAGTPANEARLARDLRAGKVDFGVLPARAWAPAGVKVFDALQAPFVIGNYDVARAAVTGPAGRALENALGKAGVEALGLVPGELRRVLSTRPLATPDAFRGMAIRIADNDTSAAVIRSLDARPVEQVSAEAVPDQLRSHKIAGVETAPVFAVGNHYEKFAKNITGYALFDRIDTLVASRAAWKRLAKSQQSAVRGAAKDTLAAAATLPKREGGNLALLCRAGVHVTQPTDGQLAALADATEPVRAALRQNPATGPILKQLEATAGAGPQALAVPAECTKPAPKVASMVGSAAIPDGTYKVRDTVADFKRWGQYGDEWEVPVTFTTVLKDGRWRHSQKPDFGTEPVINGTFKTKGDIAYFKILAPEGATEIPPWTARWSYYKGRLTFQPVDIADLGLRIIFGAHPWKKVG